ncbi:MAG TPA: GNAT family N-acetyltransferase [Dehalococcoidia bacterium]|nr:GNAT family N-acetyltransferase [Dehalococcoidia bacterium]
MDDHPLAAILTDAINGAFPPADGSVRVLPRWDGPADAAIDFSNHSLIVADIEPAEVQANLPHRGPGAVMNAHFLSWLAHRLGTRPGVLDLVVVAFGRGGDANLIPRDDLWDHPRVVEGRRYRRNLRLYSDRDRRAVVSVGSGLVGRSEVSIEINPEHRAKGLGRQLAAEALSLVPAGEPLFAQVSAGNVASVRAFLAAGYRPICAEVGFWRPV